MTPRLWLLWSVVILTAALGIALAVRKAAAATRAGAQSLTALQSLQVQLSEIDHLRSALPAWAASPAPGAATDADQPLAPRISEAIKACGLPPASLVSLSADSGHGNNPATVAVTVVRRRANLTLTGLTLPQLGAFLATWRTREPAWPVTAIDLSPQGVQAIPTGGDLPLRAVIALESISLNAPAPAANLFESLRPKE